jgi:hypothetical protein
MTQNAFIGKLDQQTETELTAALKHDAGNTAEV